MCNGNEKERKRKRKGKALFLSLSSSFFSVRFLLGTQCRYGHRLYVTMSQKRAEERGRGGLTSALFWLFFNSSTASASVMFSTDFTVSMEFSISLLSPKKKTLKRDRERQRERVREETTERKLSLRSFVSLSLSLKFFSQPFFHTQTHREGERERQTEREERRKNTCFLKLS
jgi:hypothetical protein